MPRPDPKDANTRRRMKRQRRKDTAPEMAVRRALTSLGSRYRVHVTSLPGSPDIANKARGWAIFVHGCFWHHHPACPYGSLPKSNQEWWQRKFEDNRRRDINKVAELKRIGLRVLEIWECETKVQDDLKRRLRDWLRAC